MTLLGNRARRPAALACLMITLISTAAKADSASIDGPATPASDGPDPAAPSEHRPALTAARRTSPIRIDGRLDEAAWRLATAVDQFTQIVPDEGVPVTERTEAWILFDDEALYVGVRLHDSGPISSRLGRRDMPIDGDSDWFGVMLDSNHDHRTAYGFDVSPAGVKRDGVKTINLDDTSWDPVWEVASTVDSEGWTAEYRIPFSQLRFSGRGSQTWGIQLERLIARKGEYAVTTFIPATERGGVPEYGHLIGLEDIRPAERLELLPYAVARGGTGAFGRSVGLDLQYRMTTELTVNATLNPDFGQVELDPAVVNLTAFETFHPEHRPFFVEGAGIFEFGGGALGPGSAHRNLFYSRRVGRRPQLLPQQVEVDAPVATRILGAAKLSGKTAGGWSIGLLEVATRAEKTPVPGGGMEDGDQIVEPLTNYLVGRVVRDARDGGSALGLMFTAVDRRLETPGLEAALRHAAHVGGVDFRHEWAGGSWGLSGFAIGSHVAGSRESILATQHSPVHGFQRPDSRRLALDPEATSITGGAAQLQLQKLGGRHWRGDVGVFAASPGFELNDAGYLSRADMTGANAQLRYLHPTPGKLFRSYSLGVSSAYVRNFDGDHTGNGLSFRAAGQLQNFWRVNLYVGNSMPALDDRLTRGGPLAAMPATTHINWIIASDARRTVTGELNGTVVRNGWGERNDAVQIAIGVKPSPAWSIAVKPMLQRVHSPAQYVATIDDPLATATYGRRYVFAPLDQTAVSLESRLDLTFAPNLTLELFARPFVSSVELGAPRQLMRPRGDEFGEYGRDLGTAVRDSGGYRVDPDGGGPAPSFDVRDGDFSLRSLRGNAVLRWEWNPGSMLYIAWQQTREDVEDGTSDFLLRRDARALLGTPPRNVLLVKVNRWLSF